MRFAALAPLALAAACAAPEDARPPPLTPAAPMVGASEPAAPLPKTAFAPSVPTAPRTIAREPSNEPPPRRRIGRLIDLDVKDADIHDVCRLLAETGGVNVVVADDVHGSVTIRMKRVPWDRAFDAILQAKGLSASWDGNIVVVSATSK